jgi:hypothetical protein
MVEETEALDKNEAWDLVKLPNERKLIGSKWVYKKKLNAKGGVEKYKACMVENRYSQVERIDFGEIFSTIAKSTSIRFILFLVAAFVLEVEQMGCKSNVPTWGPKRRNLHERA